MKRVIIIKLKKSLKIIIEKTKFVIYNGDLHKATYIQSDTCLFVSYIINSVKRVIKIRDIL